MMVSFKRNLTNTLSSSSSSLSLKIDVKKNSTKTINSEAENILQINSLLCDKPVDLGLPTKSVISEQDYYRQTLQSLSNLNKDTDTDILNDQYIHDCIEKLQNTLCILNNKLSQPQIIQLNNFYFIYNLDKNTKQNFCDSVYSLFSKANIPVTWIVDIKWSEANLADSKFVQVIMLNYYVKNTALKRIHQYFYNKSANSKDIEKNF
jgi:hypothetical protein